MKRKIKIKPEFMRAALEPKSFNEEDRTVDVIWTTGSRVKRFSFEGEFFEELSLKKSHVDLGRLNGGAPVLNNHGTDTFGGVRDLNDVIGTVVEGSARIEKGRNGNAVGVATLKLSGRADVAGIIQDIKEGIIRNVSVGYRVNKFEERKEKIEGIPVLRAVDWTPMELSFVGIPADAGAQARSEQPTNEAFVTIEQGESEMQPKNKKQVRSEDEVKPEEVTNETQEQEQEQDAEAAQEETQEQTDAETKDETAENSDEQADKSDDAPESDDADGERGEETVETATVDADKVRAEEMHRQDAIRKNCDLMKLDREFADKLCSQKITLDEARSLIFEELEKRTQGKTKNQRVEVIDMDQRQARKQAFVRTIAHRADSSNKLENGDNEYMRFSLIETARAYMKANGARNIDHLSNFEIAERALHSTSDFVEVLKDSSNKFLREAYDGAPNTFAPFIRTRAAKDFKELSSIMLGNGGKLEKVNEHGEYKATTIDESAEKYKVEKFGLIIGKTYELMVNDDLDAFSDLPRKLGMRAREKENEIFWSLITANSGFGQTMAETGQPLFDAAHGNLAVGGDVAAIGIASLGKGRESMRLQRDLDGELTRTIPRYLVVPAALETLADQFLSQITPNQNGQVNPFANNLQKVQESRLDGVSQTGWYLFGAAGESAIAEMASLGGRGPEIFQKEGFDVDGLQIKIRHHFGMKVVDFRNVYYNPGA